jgi:hypothetical protein
VADGVDRQIVAGENVEIIMSAVRYLAGVSPW